MQTLKKTPKPLIALKQVETDHFTALLKKQSNDTDLIDDIRHFCKSKANADREYAQTLQKLVQNLIIKRRHLMEKEENEEDNIWTIWRRLMLQYEEAIMMRINTSEMLQRLSEQIKPLRNNRVSTNKRILDQLKCLQIDLFSCVQEMSKAQKVYAEDERETYEVKMKAEDAAAKVRNKSTNLFNSMADLHRNSDKLTSRLDAYQTRSTAARNEYLFQLAAINAHLNNYFKSDLPDYSEILDADIYTRVKELFVTITKDEYNFSKKQTEIWDNLIELSNRVNREYHWKKFMATNPSFLDHLEYKFQPIKNDKITLLISPNPKDDTLGNVTRKLVKRLIVREHKISGYEKEIKSLESGKVTPPPSGASTILSPNPPDSDMGMEDLVSYNQEYVEHKVEELKFAIRKEKIEKVKIEACLHLLRKSGVDTEQILQEARSAVAAATEMMIRTNSTSGRHHHHSHPPYPEPHHQEDGAPFYYPDSYKMSQHADENGAPYPPDHYLDNPDAIRPFPGCNEPDDDPEVYSISQYSGGYNITSNRAVSSVPYDSDTASNTTPSHSQYHLNLPGNSHAAVSTSPSTHTDEEESRCDERSKNGIEEEKGDDEITPDSYDDIWSKEKEKLANEENDKGDSIGKAVAIYEFQADEGNWEEMNLVIDEEVDILVEADHDGWIKVRSLMDGKEGIVPVSYLKIEEMCVRKQKKAESPSHDQPDQPSEEQRQGPSNEDLVRAVYAFGATSGDELELQKGDVIKVITRLSNEGVDDGWWEGYKMEKQGDEWITGARGVFPSMLVVKYVAVSKQPITAAIQNDKTTCVDSPPPPPIPEKKYKLKNINSGAQKSDITSSSSLSESGNSSQIEMKKRPSLKLDLSKIQKSQSEVALPVNIPESCGTTERIGDYVRLASESSDREDCPDENLSQSQKPATKAANSSDSNNSAEVKEI